MRRMAWLELGTEAEDLLWRVVGEDPLRTPLTYARARDLFFQAVGVAGRFRYENASVSIRCYLVGGGSAQVWTRSTLAGGAVALAAASGPEGPFAEEVLALATTMLVSGLTSEVAP